MPDRCPDIKCRETTAATSIVNHKRSMPKKFKNLEEFLISVKLQPEMLSLIQWDAHPSVSAVLGIKAASAFADAFGIWYEARTYFALGEAINPGGQNGYPGDRAVFSLALKASFLSIRYAWPKAIVDRALEAFARSLPDVEEVDSYPETQEFVKRMQRRLATLKERPKPSAETAEPNPNCGCPACQLRKLIETGAPSGAEGTGEAKPGAAEQTALKELLDVLSSVARAKPESKVTFRQKLQEQGEKVRRSIGAGTLASFVANVFAGGTDELDVLQTQVALSLSAELGFGDIVQPFVEETNRQFPGLGFVASPAPSTKAFAEFEEILKDMRERLDTII